MKVFADSVYFLAMLIERDQWQKAAIRASKTAREEIVTTDWVLTEVANALSGKLERNKFSPFMEWVRNDPMLSIVPATRKLFNQGVSLYEDRPDKEWSLTDCISFIVMQEQGLTAALTADRHFEQAGFTCLLLDEIP